PPRRCTGAYRGSQIELSVFSVCLCGDTERDMAIDLPALGLGTWAWGDTGTWGMDGYDRSYDFDTIRAAYRASIDAGVTLLDTAEMYGDGESERIIGRLLAEDAAR